MYGLPNIFYCCFNSSKFIGGNIVNIPLIIDLIISIGDKSEELEGHLDMISPLSLGPLSFVGI